VRLDGSQLIKQNSKVDNKTPAKKLGLDDSEDDMLANDNYEIINLESLSDDALMEEIKYLPFFKEEVSS